MAKPFHQRLLLSAALAVLGSLAQTAAEAAEPLLKMASSLMHTGTNGRTPTASMRLPADRLDLTPPSIASLSRASSAQVFPMAHQPTQAIGETRSADSQRIASPAQQLARNFHRDGLPVAKLFQSENSLVHLGLNQKGKPGLWFIEKIH